MTRGSNVQSLSASWTVDSEGRPSSVTYPSWKTCLTCTTVPGSSYTYAYDTMGRLNTMTDTVNTMTDTVNTRTMISGTTYGVANEVQQMTSGYTTGVNTESRSYNGMFQLTQLTVGSALNISYAYSATQNNGKITSQTDALSGEQVLYTYDSLNRLASAQTAGSGGWGQSYTYDGFGNLTDQTLIKGTAPDVHVAYNYLTNLQTGDTADANGNIGSGYNYDMENRLVQPGSSSTARYAYDAANKRVWRGDTGVDEITFWAGQKLATYQISTTSGLYFTLTSTNVYFGSKLISKGTYNSSGTGDYVTLTPVAADRLGSIGKFYPYGVERPSATANDKEKFTGYFRDAATGLDYANARYHQSGVGRFMTPDPFGGSAKLSNPGSWNRYAYVMGDPTNARDPSGLCAVVSAGLNESSGDNTGESKFASSPQSEGGLGGAMEAYPYVGSGQFSGALNVGISQLPGMEGNAQARTLADAITAAGADSSDPINLYLFSGSGGDFADAVKLLSPDVIARIQSITYLSPGTAGTLITVNGITPTVVTGTGLKDIAAMIGTTIPFGWNVIPTDCGHNAGCLAAAAPKQASGNSCNHPQAFSWPNFDYFSLYSWINSLRSAAASLAYGGIFYGGGGSYDFQPIEWVTSTISFPTQ